MNKRVLIVDDEEMIVTGLMTLFELESFEIAGALDRSTAEELVSASYYPVVIADLCLRTIEDGLAVIDHIRECSPGSRVLVLTAFAAPNVVADLRARGVEVVLQKPTPGGEIIEAVLALLAEIEAEAAAEHHSLEELYLSARSKLYGLTRRRFNLSHDAAEDVLQEAWMMFLERRAGVRTPGPWLAGTVVNLARQHLDRRKRRRETSEEDSGMVDMPVLSISDADDVLAVRQVMARLDEKSRMLCELIGMNGLSYDEVSAATGMPIGSVGPMYMRAKQKLRSALAH